MSSLRLTFALALLAAACNDTALPASGAPSPDLAQTSSTDLGFSSPTPTRNCIARDKCSCGADPDCTPVAQPCWCEVEECGNGDCFCGGGAYVGCAPRGCPTVLNCPLAQLPTAPDSDGCFRCPSAPLQSCEAAKAQLAAACGFSADYLGGLSCQANGACIARCIESVNSCSEVGCGFCTVCDCADLFSPFAQCVTSCLLD